MRRSRESPHRLNAGQRTARLVLSSTLLVDDLYAIAKDQVASEAARDVGLTGKATALLTASGLALTVAFTFGGLLIQHPEFLSYVPASLKHALPIIYGLALILGLAASAFALWALLIRGDYVGISETNVFNQDVLTEADRLDMAYVDANLKLGSASEQAPAPSGEAVPPLEGAGTAHFRRFMTDHLWDNYFNNFDIHQTKASRIRTGQLLFVLFLLSIAVIGIVLTVVAKNQQAAPIVNQPSVSVRCEPGRQGPPGPPGPPGPTGQPGSSAGASRHSRPGK